jgi:hypothetical protein
MMRVRSLFLSAIFGVALFAVALPLRGLVAEIITANIYLVQPGDVQHEDAYVAANSAHVDGTIDGDLVISTGSLEISGTVSGDVLVLSQGTVEVTGNIDGSLRGIARDVIIDGTVGDDVTVTAVSTEISGTVTRDVLFFGGSLDMSGEVGRDVKGRMISASLNGTVGHDVDISVGALTLGGDTKVTGDLLYRSGVDGNIAGTVQVGGRLERLPTRGVWEVELILTVATLIGFLGFIFTGIVLLWLFRRTTPRAIKAVVEHPLRASLMGIGALIVVPVLIVIMMLTLVGVPIAVLFLLLFALGLFFGPVPAVTALGSKILRSRGGLFAAFVVGAVLWRLGIWFIPLVGVVLYFVALALGVGGWVMAVWEVRKETPVAAELLPARRRSGPEPVTPPVGWDAPRAPGPRNESTDEEEAPAVEELAEEAAPEEDTPAD